MMSSPALESWMRCTVLIENDWGELGTGFLVERQIDQRQAKAFMVSNKHVLNEDPQLRVEAKEIHIHVNMRSEDGSIVGKKAFLPLRYADSSRRWREHPDPDVDVIAFNVSSLVVNFPQLEKRMADYSTFADEASLQEHDISIGDDVLVVGYPRGMTQGPTNFPIVRSGMIASQIGEPFHDEIEEHGKRRERRNRGFLVDGATVPGSSGSPVILKPVSGRYVGGEIRLNVAPALLLGIITETYYAPVITGKWNIDSFAGLGLALDAETIRETIELFFQADEDAIQ